ncbi:glycoside hydrolase family 9 protein [Alteromonas stellipolaris]|uniref:glycoside hydrolase family 9 protein n=1 Tax=Alteromonas stellipolaris TaxID=233316 RepID=UPI0030F5D4C1
MYRFLSVSLRFKSRTFLLLLFAGLTSLFMTGCSDDNRKSKFQQARSEKPLSIKLNQVGYLPSGKKHALVPTSTSGNFVIKRATSDDIVYQGELEELKVWELSNDPYLKLARFSDFDDVGEFYIDVEGVPPSLPFSISPTIYDDALRAALKSYYFNRSGMALSEEYAGQWKRPVGHPDTQANVHHSATTSSMDALTTLSSEKGWYDAGDYGKYSVNAGIATYTLLAAYEHFPQYYQAVDVAIPESGDDVADLLNELRWNLDWMASMQRHDGAVFHKLTTLEWAGIEMPHEDKSQRFMIGVSTSATLDFAATMATASRIYKDLAPNIANQWLLQAEAAWQWAVLNPDVRYVQPDDVQSGEYGDDKFVDEFFWAASELFIATGNTLYLSSIIDNEVNFGVPGWADVETLGLISLLKNAQDMLSVSEFARLESAFIKLAENITEQIPTSPYLVPMQEDDFVWGSNSVLLNKALILLTAYELNGNAKYKDAVYDSISYIFGMNPTGYSFVTGYGSLTPMSPHHRISASDGVIAPIPGMLVGGPHAGRQDECDYPYLKPADSYIDDWCSFSTNEIAINWNAPLVYVLGAINALSQ